MKTLLAALSMVAAMITGLAAAEAQVINGESIYEDNFAHVPPKPSDEAPAAAKQAPPDSSATRPAPPKPGHAD